MQRNTRKRIAYYQEALPDVKKRVAAAALMLFVAVLVSVVASYAWVTLSMAPVVSSIDTTVSSNGTLEIALSPADASEPLEFDIDESATASTDVTVSNLQWGNLINLSDIRYGLDHMVLRPAQLNTASLKTSPLWGAVYGADGRISTLDSNYTFVSWNGSEFAASREYGVRGIASYKVVVSDSTSAAQRTLAEEANAAHGAVNTQYNKVHKMLRDMDGMLNTYVQSEIPESYGGGATNPFNAADLGSAYDLYEVFLEAMELHKEALVALAKYQAFVAGNTTEHNYADINWDYLVNGKANFNAASTTAKSKDGVISLVGLNQFITDLNSARTDIEYLRQYYDAARTSGAQIYWNSGGTNGYQISNIITRLLDQNSLTIVVGGNEITVGQLGSNPMGYATDLLATDSTKVTLKNGILKRFEQTAIDEAYRMQGDTNGATVDVTAKVKVSVLPVTKTIKGKAYTSASGASYYMTNYSQAMGQQMAPSDAVAEDTYGMAVDFWLRTNAEETYLTLEGAIATEEDGTVMSYDGVNRVWGSTDATTLTTNSTTQGGGSCYIYYADTPEDMNRSLELLRSMKVALVDADGNLMALAAMDTANYYAVNGRITVPLVIEENSGVTYTYKDAANAEQTGRAVVRMTHDEAKWVTAIVFLDGAYLTNDHVLSAADIDGQLNIQFGSSQDLKTRGDNNLLTAERVVTASVDKTSMNFITAVDTSELTTNVTVRVEGTNPTNVTAFFVRAINNTQGERQDTMTFQKQGDGTWTTSYAFTAPGTYYLRHVRLDGVDYALENPPMVEVEGFTVQSIGWGEADKEATVYSAENYYEEPVTVKFASSDASKMPTTVQARFLRDDGNIVNVDMGYDPTTSSWKGTGTFYTAGEYTLQYLLLNGEYYDISNHGYKMTLYLGLGVTVYNGGSSTNDMFVAGQIYDKHVGVKIADNAGNELTEMEGARLYYSMGGSASNTVDTDLTWDAVNGWYTGTLPIRNAGRYAFQRVTIAGSNLTRYTEAPTFVIVSPDPPQYVTSTGHFYNDVQFAPLTNDAYIGPIKIDHAESATMSVVVHNSATGEEVTILAATDKNPNGVVNPVDQNGKYTNSRYYQGGDIYFEADYWYVDLPSYTSSLDTDNNPTPNADYTQEGIWSVKQISAWDCYDETSTFRGESNPIVWTDTDVDFSKLTTDVSCSINVSMTYGDTELGDAEEPFMTEHPVKDLGLEVRIVDNEGRAIPANKIATDNNGNKQVKLTVAYNGNSGDENVAKYGYESNYLRTYEIFFEDPDGDGTWTVSGNGNHIWQYVGEYKVNGLTVDLTNNEDTEPGSGAPELFTVTSAAPTAENLKISELSQGQTVFGKNTSNGSVDGTFLSEYTGANLGAVTVSLQYNPDPTKPDVWADATYAKLSGVTSTLVLDYQGGSDTHGGYTWTGTNPLEDITVAMTDVGSNNRYVAGTTTLLAGTYKVRAEVSINGDTKRRDGKDIEVYSLNTTEVNMTNVSPNTEVDVNKTTGTNSQFTANADIFKANNTVVNNGKSALVYMQYKVSEKEGVNSTTGWTSTKNTAKFADYTAPIITFEISGHPTAFADVTLTIPDNNNQNIIFDDTNNDGKLDVTSTNVNIGWTKFGNSNIEEDWTINYDYETEIPQVVGEVAISQFTATVDHTVNGATTSVNYTFPLLKPLTIVQRNEAAPSIILGETSITAESEVLVFAARDPISREDGLAFDLELPSRQDYNEIQKTIQSSDRVTTKEWTLDQTVTEPMVAYRKTYSSVSGYPNGSWNRWGTTYTAYDKWTATYNVYQHKTETYSEEATVTKNRVPYGLIGWEVDGEIIYLDDAGETTQTVRVDKANMVIKPVIGDLTEYEGYEATFVSREDSRRTKTVETDVFIKSFTFTGDEKSGTGSTYAWRDEGKTKAEESARGSAQSSLEEKITSGLTGYTIKNAETAPKYPDILHENLPSDWVSIPTT